MASELICTSGIQEKRVLIECYVLCRDGDELVVCNRIDTSASTSSGLTALHLAAQGGWVKVVQQLLNCGHKW